MTTSDITILFLTPNKVPKKWAMFHKNVLVQSAGEIPFITISREPLDWGMNLIQEEYGHANIYRQMLRGAKIAKTPYVAIAEDDTLYPKDHFTCFRPPLDTFAFNLNRWFVLTWGTPIYFLKQRMANTTMIAPTQLLIESLEERFAKGMNDDNCGELGIEKVDRRIGSTVRKSVGFYSKEPTLGFCHTNALDPLERRRRKYIHEIRAYDIPTWGRVEEIVKKFA